MSCHHQFQRDVQTSENVCVVCGLISDVEMIRDYNENYFSHLYYKPTEYVNSQIRLLSNIEGDIRQNDRFFICDVINALPNKFNWTEAYRALKKVSFGMDFLTVPSMLGHPVYIPDYVKEFGLTIKYGNYQKCDKCKVIGKCKICGSYNLKSLFIWYKMAEIRNDIDFKWIPMKACTPTLIKYDCVWKQVCEEYGLPFIKTKIYIMDITVLKKITPNLVETTEIPMTQKSIDCLKKIRFKNKQKEFWNVC